MPTPIEKSSLENGLQVVTRSMPASRSVAIGVLSGVGPYDEPPGKEGIAHLLEHSLFQGTASRSAGDIARLMDEAGGSVGGLTSRDYTVYYAVVLDDHVPYALDLLADVLLSSIFPQAAIDREKAAIVCEREAALDDGPRRCHELARWALWPDHPLGRSIAGDRVGLAGISREDLIYFLHETYRPERLMVAAAGNVLHEDFVAQTRDGFWRMIGAPLEQPAAMPALPQPRTTVRVENAGFSLAYFSLALPAPAYGDPLRYPLHVLQQIVGSGLSSRLFRRLREELALVYDVSCSYDAYRQAGLITIAGSTLPAALEQVIVEILSELGGLVRGTAPLDEEEMTRAKRRLRAQVLVGSEDPHGEMSRLLTQELYFGRYVSGAELVRELDAVDEAELQHTAEVVFGRGLEAPALAVVGPRGAELPCAEKLREVIECNWQALAPAVALR